MKKSYQIHSYVVMVKDILSISLHEPFYGDKLLPGQVKYWRRIIKWSIFYFAVFNCLNDATPFNSQCGNICPTKYVKYNLDNKMPLFLFFFF